MIAISAELATVSPKVGPIDSTFGSSASPKSLSSALLTSSTSLGASVSVEIWTTFSPSSGLSTVWIFASASPCSSSALRTASTLADCSSGAVIRVPDSKSMPKLMPLPAIASAPISRITPDAEKNHFDAPMKSNVILCLACPAPSAERLLRSFVPRRLRRIAWVASTAVNSDTIVPMPSMNAKPLTPAVARMKRMNATSSVTTLASMIVEKPFL